MDTFEQELDQYFNDYCGRMNDALEGKTFDQRTAANAFSDTILSSTPDGIGVSGNSEHCSGKLSKELDFYRSIGTTCMVIDKKEFTPLDTNHALAKIHWKANYEEGKTGQMVGFNTFYLLKKTADNWKCFAYMAGDEQKALKEHGLI